MGNLHLDISQPVTLIEFWNLWQRSFSNNCFIVLYFLTLRPKATANFKFGSGSVDFAMLHGTCAYINDETWRNLWL